MKINSKKITLVLFLSLAFIGCGKENNTNRKTELSSSSQSSNDSAETINIEFIYPPFKANLNGASETKLILKVTEQGRYIGDIYNVYIGDLALVNNGSEWVTGGQLLQLADGVKDQHFLVQVETELGLFEAKPLILSTHASGLAGVGGSIYPTDIEFNSTDNFLYFSDPYSQSLSYIDSSTSQRYTVYERPEKIQGSTNKFWNFEIDSNTNILTLLVETSELDNEAENEGYSIDLVNIDLLIGETTNTKIVQQNTNDQLLSARSIIPDFAGSLPSINRKGDASFYIIDEHSSATIKRVITKKNSPAYSYSYAITAQNTSSNNSTNIEPAYGPLSIIRMGDSLIVARETSDIDGLSLGSLIEYRFSEELVFGEYITTIIARTFAEFKGENGVFIAKPTALALNHDGTALFIADNRRIWEMDITTQGVNKPFKLISSSNNSPRMLGIGSPFGSTITAMEMHPDYDILYVASAEQGILAIDIMTGNRINVAK